MDIVTISFIIKTRLSCSFCNEIDFNLKNEEIVIN